MEKYPLIISVADLLRIVLPRRGSTRPGFIATLALTAFLVLGASLPGTAGAHEIANLSVKTDGMRIVVSANLVLDESHVSELRKGLQKELIFYIDLFKVWEFWPDEFIQGIKVYHTMKSDPVKGEFILLSAEQAAEKRAEKGAEKELRFNSVDSLLQKALAIEGVQIVAPPDIEPGYYFVKVTAESKLIKLSPIVSNLLFFIPETEFKVFGKSTLFRLGEQ